MPESTPLDVTRVAATAEELGFDYDDPAEHEEAARILAADDAHARSRGLVCQGDGLRAAEVVHAATCMDEDCTRCDALLAALPSSLLDNPEADRG